MADLTPNWRAAKDAGKAATQLAGAIHAVRGARHFGRRMSGGFIQPLTGSNGESFMQPTGEEAEALWEHTLIHYGYMADGDARQIAEVFVNADLPPPSNDCKAFLTHEFLISLGITSPGERARVLLAVERMPPPSLHLGSLQMDEHQVRMSSVTGNGAGLPPSYSTDTAKVKTFVLKSKDNSLTWVDLVGKDGQFGAPGWDTCEFTRSFERVKRLFEADAAATSTHSGTLPVPPTQVRQHSASGSYRASSLNAPLPGQAPAAASGEQPPSPMTPVDGVKRRGSTASAPDSPFKGLGTSGLMTSQMLLNPAHATEDTDMWGIMALETPLPHLIHDPATPGRCSFILRVCTAGTDTGDASFSALTNRWVVFADASRNLVAVVHRVDSVSLATLRDKDFGAMSDTITFKRVLASIFVAFLMEFEIALDKGNELLDSCETHMLDNSRHNELLERLFHLERKASVYERMIDLNQSLVAEIGHYFSLSREIAFLETKWQRLREKAVALGERSTNLLQLLLALSGHRTNELMAVLTRFSLVFTPMTFIAGVYGMNFTNMPELQYEYGYYICMAVIGVLFIGGSIWSSRL